MPDAALFLFEDATLARWAAQVVGRVPAMTGLPVRIQRVRGLRDRRGPVHGGALLRERVIRFDCTGAEFPRIFVHEVFHFVWLRAGNPLRRSFESVLRAESRVKASGELGWSAEWRKDGLRAEDVRGRSRRWREYCCESFCDTAAWLYSGAAGHEEFTLETRFRRGRRDWFRKSVETRRLSI